MKMFGDINTADAKEAGDYLGGGGLFDAGVYDGTVKLAYAGKSASSDARFVEVHIDINGREFKERFFVTNRNGDPYYVDKRSGDKKFLPGYEMVNDLCMLTTEIELGAQEGEEKVVKLYDFDAKKEVPTTVPVLTALIGKPITVAILRQVVDKQKKDGNGVYQNTGETREENIADKFFHTGARVTLTEAKEGLDPSFLEKWEEKNKGQVRNKAKGAEGNSGAPAAANGGGQAKPKTSMFAS